MKKANIFTLYATAIVHAAGIGFFSFSIPSIEKQERQLLKIVTKQSISLEPKITHTAHNHLPKNQAPQKLTTPVKPKPKPVQKKKPTSKKSTTNKQKVVKKNAPTKSKQVRKQLDQNLAKITPTAKPNSKESAPKTDQKGDAPSSIYFGQVCALFRESLMLPEKGAVKLTISVQANGKIDSIKPVSSESEKNLQYLQAVLLTIELPEPSGASAIEFTITFCDD